MREKFLRQGSASVRAASGAALLCMILVAAPLVRAQAPLGGSADPSQALAAALSAACAHDDLAFARQLTAANDAAFRQLPLDQRVALMKRLVLLDDVGKPVLSAGEQGRTVLHCEAGGDSTEMRLGAPETHEALAFIPVEVPIEGDQPRAVRFGLVREGGEWKLLSVGMLLLDLPSLQQQWEQSDLDAREAEAVAALRNVADALKKYQEAFGKLPETLEPLGPAPPEGASPEHAGFLDAQLAGGATDTYRFRYNIMPAAVAGDESQRDKADGFALAAVPVEYGKSGRRSFYLDATGTLRGGDDRGAAATVTDPKVPDPQP